MNKIQLSKPASACPPRNIYILLLYYYCMAKTGKRADKKLTLWLPDELYNKVEEYVNDNSYTGISEFMRTLLRDFFEVRK